MDGEGFNGAELAGRGSVTVAGWLVITSLGGGGVSLAGCAGGGCRLQGCAGGCCFFGCGCCRLVETARACRSVGWSSRKVSSTFTCFIPDERVKIVFPLNW